MLKTAYKETEHAELKEAVEKLVTEYGPIKKIILFGSQARGQVDSYSDTDLIVIKETDKSFVARQASLPFLPLPADVFVYTPQEFELMQKNENPFIINALSSSRVLYPL